MLEAIERLIYAMILTKTYGLLPDGEKEAHAFLIKYCGYEGILKENE